MSPVMVFFCGEALRGDDAVALEAAAGVLGTAGPSVSVRLCAGLAPSDLLELPPGARVVIVDAVTGVSPGALIAIDLRDVGSLARVRTSISSHQLPLDQVLGLATLLGWVPEGTFLGLGAERFEPGAGLSDAVAQALPRLRAAVLLEIARLSTPSLAA